ncbi:MAG: S28 family serine protease [Melioribacteraceae bacterium]|nr:S28 family serine protease [Melioribacteraceae bacterium]
MRRCLNYFILILFIYSISYSQTESELLKQLKSFREIAEIKEIKTDTTYQEGYEILINQPVDHKNPKSKTFTQKIYLSHSDYSKPMVFVTEGYAANRSSKTELARILEANQIIVEHRYFGKSVPENLDWNYLTVEQAANDHHEIVELFKKLYIGKWVNTGVSKGGQTTLYHRYFYPHDVDVSVPYVAPINLAQEDPRIYMFLNSVGTEECREKIKNFQRAFLSKRDEVRNLLMKDAEQGQIRFAWDYDFVLEYMTLEYSFAFWQWGQTKCEDIPEPDASAEVLYNHMKASNPLYFFTEQAMKDFAPFYVQAYNEIGYYGYDLSPFKDLLTEIEDGSNIMLVPESARIEYNCSSMQKVNKWLQKEASNILYIYGGNDTWNATSVQLLGENNSLKMVKKGGAHGTSIRSFDGEEKELIYTTLGKWLGMKVNRL